MKTSPIIVGTAALALAGACVTTGFAARQFYVNPELQALRDLAAARSTDPLSAERLKSLAAAEAQQKRYEQGVSEFDAMTDAQKNAVGEETKQRYERTMADIRRYEQDQEEYKAKVRQGLLPPPTLTGALIAGIRDGAGLDLSGEKSFQPVNYWTSGHVFNKETARYDLHLFEAGYAVANPLQGMVKIEDDPPSAQGKSPVSYYPAPTATGPLKILAERDGVLALISLPGTYDVYDEASDTHSTVTVPGGSTAVFDTKTHTFVSSKQ